MTRGGKIYYYLTDALGSVVALTDASGNKVNEYSYSPRGVTRAATSEQVPQPYRFAGAYQDPTGLYKMGARYHDTHIGRFTQTDPSGKETNPYLYAAGDYINRIAQIAAAGAIRFMGGTVGVAGKIFTVSKAVDMGVGPGCWGLETGTGQAM